MFRLPVCKTGVFKRAGSDDWSVTSTSHHFWIHSSTSGAARCLREGPCGRPPGCESLRIRQFHRSVAQSLERPAWDREAAGGNPAVPTNFKLLPWSKTRGIRLLNGTMQVEILPAAPLPGSVKVARRPVKPLVLVRVQVWQPISGCNVSSRRPRSERGGRRCNSCHPDHFGWLAEQ